MNRLTPLFLVLLLVCFSVFATKGVKQEARVYAPYLDFTLNVRWDNNSNGFVPGNLTQLSSNSGIKHVTAAFITAENGNLCQAAWGGYADYEVASKSFGLQDINEFRQNGGSVIISFGGEAGTSLSEACQTVDSLQAQYQSVIDKYNVHDLDFDIEGGHVYNKDALIRQMTALHNIQQKDSSLTVSLTLAVTPSGLTQDGINVLHAAIDNGVVVTRVNIMAMDYGTVSGDQMGKNAISAAAYTEQQLQELYPNKPDALLWPMIGVTPMIGVNDVQPEHFTQSDADELLTFAEQQGIGSIGSWSIDRDQPCDQTYASNNCSGAYNGERMMETRAYQYAKVFNQFNA